MNLQHDRAILISVASSRFSTNWIPQQTTLSAFYQSKQEPTKTPEPYAEFSKMSKAQQDALKDCAGGYVGGTLSGPRRKSENMTGRDLITLDFDNLPPHSTQRFIETLDGLGVSYCIHSTRKHTVVKPRLRVIIPTDRTMTPDEYEPCARKIATYLGIEWADPTTFEVARLMYNPTVCADGEYIFRVNDAPFASADTLLKSYTDWHNWNEWPQVPGAISYQKLAVRQGDPETKTGVVGAFCRTYDIYSAMERFLPGIYEPVDNDPNRYTYLGGSTAGGAVIYDNGKFLFSHHATDPCSGKLVNAFDMVRLHKFGSMDDDAKDGTPNNRLPSYVAMCEFAVADPDVAALMAKERAEQAAQDFTGVPATNDDDPANWMQELEIQPQTGAIKATIDNVKIILENDPLLKGKFALNEFAGRGEVLGVLPWDASNKRRLWSDTDSNGLYWYLEKAYKLKGRGDIDAALDIHAKSHSFNDVQDYLTGLPTWDGQPRLDTLLSDYLGAGNDDYNRAVCRKSFTAAVARALDPGCKYDNMLILCGPQGIGKSTLLDKMSRGWFNDSIRTFEGKEASELLPGVWIVEVAELDAFRRTDVSRIKQFLSLRADRYRAAYGRHVSELPRRCVFFGTCNQIEFLQDTTGNRRFWPVDVAVQPHDKTVWVDLTNEVIDQIWAEAKARWQMGEALYLKPDMERAAAERQELHREVSPREGLIQDFVERKVPSDWSRWKLDARRDFWAQNAHGDITLVNRDRVCALEIWCELFNGDPKGIKPTDTREINSVLSRASGWKRAPGSGTIHCGADYQTQRGFVRK